MNGNEASDLKGLSGPAAAICRRGPGGSFAFVKNLHAAADKERQLAEFYLLKEEKYEKKQCKEYKN